MNIEIFRRVEQKYLLSKEQYIKLMDRISSHVEKDKYYKSTICNVYFDTTNSDLIVTSLEKPLYKEKVRLRSYGVPTIDSTVFLEIKSKYKGIVGKRRVSFKLKDFYYDQSLGADKAGREAEYVCRKIDETACIKLDKKNHVFSIEAC